jgi:hypothetical protein
MRLMRDFLSSLCLALLVCACGGGDDTPPPTLDGTWSATAQGAGNSLTLRLTTQDAVVSGAGGYIQTGRIGVVAIAGTYQPPVAALTFNYDNGDTALYTASLPDGGHMNGRLTYQNGASLDLDFVRQ